MSISSPKSGKGNRWHVMLYRVLLGFLFSLLYTTNATTTLLTITYSRVRFEITTTIMTVLYFSHIHGDSSFLSKGIFKNCRNRKTTLMMIIIGIVILNKVSVGIFTD
jgi:hypothetical protein